MSPKHFIILSLFLFAEGKWFFSDTLKIDKILCRNLTCSILMKVDETKFNGSIFQVKIDLSFNRGRGSIEIQQVDDKGSIVESISHSPYQPVFNIIKKSHKIFCHQNRCVDEICVGKGRLFNGIWTPRFTFENSWVGPGVGLKVQNGRLVVHKYGENNVGYWYSSCNDQWKYETKKYGENVEVLYL